MSDSNSQTDDMAGNLWRLLKFWGPPIALLFLSGNFGWWGFTIGWTAALVWMGTLCVLNARQCNRVHCIFTGPFFLVMAAITLLIGLRIIPLGTEPWSILGAVIAVGGVGLWVIPEVIWGKYWTASHG